MLAVLECMRFQNCCSAFEAAWLQLKLHKKVAMPISVECAEGGGDSCRRHCLIHPSYVSLHLLVPSYPNPRHVCRSLFMKLPSHTDSWLGGEGLEVGGGGPQSGCISWWDAMLARLVATFLITSPATSGRPGLPRQASLFYQHKAASKGRIF